MPLLNPATPPDPTHYEVDGLKLPRVSAIVGVLAKPGLERWRGNVGNEKADQISREARDFGTRFHAAVELANKTLPGDLLEEFAADVFPHVTAYADWFLGNVARVVACERRVVSRQHGFAGTADCVVELQDGDLATLDYKTGKTNRVHLIEPGYRLQLAAYRLALAEDGIICRRRLILTFPKDAPGRLQVHDLNRHREDTAAFLACLEVYKWLNG